MEIVKINDTGRANLIEWIETVARHPENAAAHAARLIRDFDGSDIGATQIVELIGAHTIGRRPMTYTFGLDELAVIHIDGDGNEIPAGWAFAEA